MRMQSKTKILICILASIYANVSINYFSTYDVLLYALPDVTKSCHLNQIPLMLIRQEGDLGEFASGLFSH